MNKMIKRMKQLRWIRRNNPDMKDAPCYLLAVDKDGNIAVIATDQPLPSSCVANCDFLCGFIGEAVEHKVKVLQLLDEAVVSNLKVGINLQHPFEVAKPLYGRLHKGGMRFRIGFYLDYGFCIPSRQGLSLYLLENEDGSPVDSSVVNMQYIRGSDDA